MNPPVIRPIVYIVDDDATARQSVSFLLGALSLDTRPCASPAEFFAACQPGVPGCIILDVRMPGMSGLELQERLTEQMIDLPIIFVSGHGDIPMVVRAMRHGAIDFLQKPYKDQDLLDRVQFALEKDRRRQQERREEVAVMAHYEFLTPRERDIMALILSGKTNKGIALALDISPKTVETHRARVMEKMNVETLAELFQANAIIERIQARRQSG